MRKVIAGINMTIDGYCDHTAITPDEDIHHHYAAQLNQAGVILFGRITYQLMQFWQTLLQQPSGDASMDDFARAIDRVPKIVFSHTLKDSAWDTATIAGKSLEVVVSELKQQPGKNIFVGSRCLINALMNLGLIDELQLMVHPVVAGGGQPLFENAKSQMPLRLARTKAFKSGAILLYYEPIAKSRD